jgi:hypothetical protein
MEKYDNTVNKKLTMVKIDSKGMPKLVKVCDPGNCAIAAL